MERVNRILQHTRYREALRLLGKYEQERIFCLHDMEHFLSVARLMLLLATQDGIKLPQEILYATALLHDIGRVAQYESGEPHGQAGLPLAREVLRDCGFDEQSCDSIASAIAEHHDPTNEGDLASLLYRADKRSRNCFCCPAAKECHWPAEQKNQGVSL